MRVNGGSRAPTCAHSPYFEVNCRNVIGDESVNATYGCLWVCRNGTRVSEASQPAPHGGGGLPRPFRVNKGKCITAVTALRRGSHQGESGGLILPSDARDHRDVLFPGAHVAPKPAHSPLRAHTRAFRVHLFVSVVTPKEEFSEERVRACVRACVSLC